MQMITASVGEGGSNVGTDSEAESFSGVPEQRVKRRSI